MQSTAILLSHRVKIPGYNNERDELYYLELEAYAKTSFLAKNV